MTNSTDLAPVRVLVLGAGFGGLELSNLVAGACGDAVAVTLVDHSPGFVFGFSKLDVMFGKDTPEHATHLYRDAVMPGVEFVDATVTAIDPVSRTATTRAGFLESDIMVVALGAGVDPSATPGLVEGGHEFYSNAGAFALRETLAEFTGGRVVVGVTSTPFKCPPAPSETVMLVHEFLTERGLRDSSEIALVMPFGRPVPPSPEASAAILERLSELNIEWHPELLVRALDPERNVASLSDGSEMEYDLFLGIPKHVAPPVVIESGLTTDDWIPVDPRTLATEYPGVYAVGDVTSAGTPKAGVFAEGQARTAAEHIIATVRGLTSNAEYDGVGRCYLEFGDGAVAQVDIIFAPGERPTGSITGPDTGLAADKLAFGADRAQKWFGRSWQPCDPAASVSQ